MTPLPQAFLLILAHSFSFKVKEKSERSDPLIQLFRDHLRDLFLPCLSGTNSISIVCMPKDCWYNKGELSNLLHTRELVVPQMVFATWHNQENIQLMVLFKEEKWVQHSGLSERTSGTAICLTYLNNYLKVCRFGCLEAAKNKEARRLPALAQGTCNLTDRQ